MSKAAIDGGGRFKNVRSVGVINGTGGNWAKGYNDTNTADRVLAAVNTAAERCDRLQGFQIVHSLGGGTGSGLGARVADRIRAQYPGRTLNTFSVVPSSLMSSVMIEPYNAALSLARLISVADNTYFSDNRALYNLCSSGKTAIACPVYADLNQLISQTMSGVTTGLRFAGELNADMKKCTSVLVPYPNMHFFVPSFAPQTYRGQTGLRWCYRINTPQTISKLVGQMFTTVGRYKQPVVLAATVTLRGRNLCATQPSRIVTRTVAATVAKYGRCPYEFVKTAIYDVPSYGIDLSATLVANTTAVTDVFSRMCRVYSTMFSIKAFLRLFINEGMIEDDFSHVRDKIESLIDEYKAVEAEHGAVNSHSNNDGVFGCT